MWWMTITLAACQKDIEYKPLVLVHRALRDGTPEYLAALLLQHARRRSLRSAGRLLCQEWT